MRHEMRAGSCMASCCGWCHGIQVLQSNSNKAQPNQQVQDPGGQAGNNTASSRLSETYPWRRGWLQTPRHCLRPLAHLVLRGWQGYLQRVGAGEEHFPPAGPPNFAAGRSWSAKPQNRAWAQEGVALELVAQLAGHGGLAPRPLGLDVCLHALQVCRGAGWRRWGVGGGWGHTAQKHKAGAGQRARQLTASPSLPSSTWAANLALLDVYSCAQYTSVSPGSGVSLLRLAHICAGVPSNSRPQPRLKSVSPAGEGDSISEMRLA